MARRAGIVETKKRKKGGGRKKKEITLLRERIEAEKKDDAEYAFALYAQTMRDAEQPLNLRLQCADWVRAQVVGRPKQQIGNDDTGKFVIAVEYVNDWRAENSPADAAPGTASSAPTGETL